MEKINLIKIRLLEVFWRLGATLLILGLSGQFAVVLAQDFTAKGIVREKNGAPIPGVTIVVVGQNKGVLTDLDGNFSISVQADEKLQFSYIGYESQTKIPQKNQLMEITLEQRLNDLDEVVVLGYGSEQKIKHNTMAARNVQISKIEDLPGTNLGVMLRNQIPGLQVSGGDGRPGDGASIAIRQAFTFSKDGGNTVPLVVIDDVPQINDDSGLSTVGSLNSLNVDEIESITVLKDGAAAIYGARASQGAIIVKTKRGKVGPPKISYSGKFVTNDAVGFSKTMSTYDYGVFANRFLDACNVTSASSLFSDDELDQMKSLNYDWLKGKWHSSQTYSHSVSISGGTERVSYYTGISYVTQGPNMGTEDYGRWNFRSSVDAKVTKNIKFSASLSAHKSDRNKLYTKVAGPISDGSYGSSANSNVDYSFLLHMPKYIPYEYTINGQKYYVSPALGPQYVTNNLSTGNRVIGVWNYNAISNSGSKSISSGGSYDVNLSLQYDVPFIKGLNFRGTYAKSYESGIGEEIQAAYTLAQATNTNQQDKHLYGDHTTWDIVDITTSSRVGYSDGQANKYQLNGYVNYSGTFGKHYVTGMASIERSESWGRDAVSRYLNPQDPYQGTSATAGTIDLSYLSVTKYESGSLSYLGRITYAYADKYLFQFIVRSDASTKFAPEHYWGTFPSGSMGWVPSEEIWFKEKLPFINFLKLRYSGGLTGKDNLKSWKWMQTFSWEGDKGYQFGTNGGNLGENLKVGASPNRDATWDKCFKNNWGIDLTILDDRLGIGYDYFYNFSYDMLKSRSQEVGTPISAGGAVAEENFAAVNDWGHELSISWRDQINDFRYNVNINMSFGYGNVVKKYIEVPNKLPADNTMREGFSTIYPNWGFKVWKGTSTADGILRTQDDINNYWAYLTANAEAAGSTPKYFKTTTPTAMKLGQLAYQDLGGTLNEDGTQKGPDGVIAATEDYGILKKVLFIQGFSTNLGCSWHSFDFRTTINTSWGELRMMDLVGQSSKQNYIIWNREPFWADMFSDGISTKDATGETYTKYANLEGKYPTLGLDNVIEDSDFWQLPSFRCYISDLTLGYTLPKEYANKIGVSSARVSLTGSNLWDFYNPYPDKYRTMYDASDADFPTLRSWSLGVNISF